MGKIKSQKNFLKYLKSQENKKELDTIVKNFKESKRIQPLFLSRFQREIRKIQMKIEKQRSWVGSWIHRVRTSLQTDDKKSRKLFLNEVVLKQETVIFAALGAVFLSLACFFVGYKIGHKNVLEPEVLQEICCAFPSWMEELKPYRRTGR